jgi:PucR-like helix-turn-helix protein
VRSSEQLAAVTTPISTESLTRRLIDEVLREREPLARRIVARVSSEFAPYATQRPEDLLPGILSNVELVLRAVRDGRTPTEGDLASIVEHGKLRARQGIGVDDLLHAWRIAVDEAVETITQTGRASEIPADALLDLVTDLHRTSDRTMVAAARGHREQELALAGSRRDQRSDLVRRLLQGSLTPVAVGVHAEIHGLDTDRSYHAVRARPGERSTVADLERRLGLSAGAGRPTGLGAVIDGDLAGFTANPPAGPVDAPVGLGPPVPLHRLEESFRLASRSLATAAAFGMTGVYELGELGVRPAILADRELGDELKRRYIDPLTDNSDMAQTLIETTRLYLENGMRVEATARAMFLHANTLRYRLKRFEELTHCDLKDPDRRMEVWWALEKARLDATATITS